MVSIRVKAYILPSTKRRATASAEQLDLDGTRVRRIIEGVPLRDGTFGQADEQSLQRICVCGALAGITVPSRTVGREDCSFIEVCEPVSQSRYLLEPGGKGARCEVLFCSLRI